MTKNDSCKYGSMLGRLREEGVSVCSWESNMMKKWIWNKLRWSFVLEFVVMHLAWDMIRHIVLWAVGKAG